MNEQLLKKTIKELYDKYYKIREEGRYNQINEEMTKIQFINPLFEALEWDIRDKKGEQEVTFGERIGSGYVDYVFRLNGIPQFILEAKPLKAMISDERWVKQTIDYAFNKGITWAILCNYENIWVFNANGRHKDLIEHRFLKLDFENYLEDEYFEYLTWLSRDNFERGVLDKKAETFGRKIKATPIDAQLLTDFTKYRNILTKDIFRNNQPISQEDLDEAVQRIFDRLIFIRTCEDKKIETKSLKSTTRTYQKKGEFNLNKKINDIFQTYDKNYDSELFQPSLCDQLKISDDILERVILGMYRPEEGIKSYDFSVIDVNVLGNIYEQYLGHILKTTPKRAKLTNGRVHRKEHGIYYTPTYIVDYIVRNTVGEKLKKRGVKVDELKILDLACGSGSFLLKAFDVLTEYVVKKEGKAQQAKFEDITIGKLLKRKTELLKNTIYGVDLDPQAVEITQLNLLLKLAEKRHRLPTLQENIKCGNSLIDDSTIAGDKAFQWDEKFKIIMDNGGFDVVIGNPPYGIVFKDDEKHFIEQHLPTFKRNNDLYVAFIEKAINLLKEGGLFSFIVPNTFLIGSYFDNLKKLILEKTKIIKIIDLGTNHVFKDPNVFNSIIILQKEPNKSRRYKNTIDFFNVPLLDDLGSDLETISNRTEIMQPQFYDLIWKPKNKIIEKINARKDKVLHEICHVKDVGFNYWSIGRGKKRGGSIGSRVLYEGEKKNKKDIPFLKGRDVTKYGYIFGNHWLRHDYEKFLNKKVDIFRFSPKFLEASPKIIYRQTADRIIATIDLNKYYLDKTVHLIIPKENVELNMISILGILNSKLMFYFYRDIVREKGRTFAQVKTIYIKKIPLKFNEEIENKISKLVKKQLEKTKRLNKIGDKKTGERERIEQEIKKIDTKIDQLVYNLHGLTKKEIAIVEESLKKESERGQRQ